MKNRLTQFKLCDFTFSLVIYLIISVYLPNNARNAFRLVNTIC